MAPVIPLRPRRRGSAGHHVGAAIRSVIADVSGLERAVARLTWGAALLGLAAGFALQVFA
jgi:hypothetical protein